MADKISDIIENLKTSLQAIRGTGGYTNNFQNKVSVQRSVSFSEEEMPAINIFERGIEELDEASTNGSGIHENKLIIDIELVSNLASVLRTGLADINKKLGENTTLGGVAMKIDRLNVVWNYDKQYEKKVVGLTRTIAVTYRTAKWQGS